MTDTDLLERFEATTLSGDEFPHREHVRVAWLYLKERPLLEVLERFPRQLRKLATALGADGLYHETITWFFVILVNDRMSRRGRAESWAAFAAKNPDLFDRSSDVMNRFYEEDTWQSDLARQTFLMPDLGSSRGTADQR
jgi:hypothetical protein